MKKFTKTNQFFKKAERIIPLASQTFSKSHVQFVKGASPLFLTHGKGCRVSDVDGNEYIDYAHSMLPCILGYQYPAVDNAIRKQLKEGILLSLPSTHETELALLLKKHIPCAEMVRFGKNGSDVTAGAVRLARAVTGREHITYAGYHGWHDWYIGATTRNLGVPKSTRELTHKFEYNDLASLEKIFADNPGAVAAVIMEPEGAVAPEKNFLSDVRELAHKNGALLIFDEIITGFRWSIGGAQKYYSVTPDLATFSKGLGNGMPIAALVGKEKYMRVIEDIFFSFTFGGELLSIAAAAATIRELERKKVVKHIWEVGKSLGQGTTRLISETGLDDVLQITGKAPWQLWLIRPSQGFSDLEIKSFIQQELIEEGILWYGQHNITFAHKQRDVAITLHAYKRVLSKLKTVLEEKTLLKRLRGAPIQNIFKIR